MVLSVGRHTVRKQRGGVRKVTKEQKFKFVELAVEEKDKSVLIPRDSVILLLFARMERPIRGRTVFHKELFLMYKEVLSQDDFKRLAIVDPVFVPYKYGPFSFKLSSAIASLVFSGKIKKKGRKGSERFSITEEGQRLAGEVLEFLPSDIGSELIEKLREQRFSWDQLSGRGLTNRTLMLFPKYYVFANVKKVNWKNLRAVEITNELAPQVRVIIENINKQMDKSIHEDNGRSEYYKSIEEEFRGEIWAELYAE